MLTNFLTVSSDNTDVLVLVPLPTSRFQISDFLGKCTRLGAYIGAGVLKVVGSEELLNRLS